LPVTLGCRVKTGAFPSSSSKTLFTQLLCASFYVFMFSKIVDIRMNTTLKDTRARLSPES